MNYVVTARVGTNDAQFPDILRLYVPKGSRVLDMTYGRGIFWKRVPEGDFDLVKNDISAKLADVHEDFRHTTWPDDSFDAVVLDPPYLYVGGFKTLRGYFNECRHDGSGTTYGNKERANQGIYGVQAVDQLYLRGMEEAKRVLKPKGILILKCMDQVMSGKQVWGHVTYLDYGTMLGFENLDLFVLVRESRPLMRHKPDDQVHARRNHSYFLVFRRKR